MPELSEVLLRLGLLQYENALLENGFNSWEVVLDITEDDFHELGFKLGHRRILQREIASYRGIPPGFSLDSDGTPTSSPLSTQGLDSFPFPPQSVNAPTTKIREGKRRYRRHPKADDNAPKKPKTAYVNFADHLRTDPSVRALSFVDIAKEVGRQWQLLAPEKKHVWECNAARAMQEYEANMDEYRKTESYMKYQQYLEDFRKKQAQAKERKEAAVRSDDSSGMIEAFSRRSSSSPVSFTSISTPDLEKFNDSLSQAMSELGIGRQDSMSPGNSMYDSSRLPPQDLMRASALAMTEGTGPLLFIWTPQQMHDIIDRMYNPSATPDAMTFAEGFVMAACGAHYDTKNISEPARKTLYASATALFPQDIASSEPLRSMRILAALSFYTLLEKQLGARHLVAAGLRIARCKMPQFSAGVNADSWRRVYRTLVFLDCWLASTLGYSSEVTVTDISCAFSAAWSRVDVNDAIHHHISSISLIAAEIVKTLNTGEDVAPGHINVLTTKLDAWYRDLPPMMHLEDLTSNQASGISFYQQRSILMTHIMYLGAVVLLYRQLLVTSSDSCNRSSLGQQIGHYLKTHRGQGVAASRQIARILPFISFEGYMTKKCWLLIYWAYSAGQILLSEAGERMLGTHSEGIEDNLGLAKACLDTLEICAGDDLLALKYLNQLRPIFDSLKGIQRRHAVKSKTSIHALLHPSVEGSPPTSPSISSEKQSSNSEVLALVDQLSKYLMDPFGRYQNATDGNMRRVLTSDESCSTSWWKQVVD